MKKYHWEQAQRVVDEYLRFLENSHPLRAGRTWIEVKMCECGLVDSWRDWKFGESHAAWYACLIRTRSIRKVANAESKAQRHPSKTPETIRKIRNGTLRSSPTAHFLEIMLAQ